MEITWLGRSSFRIKGREAVVLTDPYDRSQVYPPRQTPPDIITLSQANPDIELPKEVGEAPKILKGPGEYEISRVFITGIRTYHDVPEPDGGKRRESNTVYLIEIDGIAVCHLGALEQPLSSAQVEELSNARILLAPVGNPSCLKASLETLSLLEPRIVIPMHPHTESSDNYLEPFNRFLKEMGIKEVSPVPKLTVNESSLPQQTQVVILSPQSR